MIPRKLLFLTIVSLLPAIANADVVSRLDSVNNGVGVGFPQNSLGMSLTTPDADEGWNNLEFNFLTSGSYGPLANDPLFILTNSYTGAANALSSSTGIFRTEYGYQLVALHL